MKPLERRLNTGRRASALMALWAALLGLAGCEPIAEIVGNRPPDAAVVDSAVPDAVIAREMVIEEKTEVVPGMAGPSLSDLSTLPLLGRVPASTPLAVAIAPPIIWDTRIDLQGIVDTLGPWGQMLRSRSQDLFGSDLTDPKNWRRIWLDATAPLTAAVLEVEPLTIAVGGRITDPDAMRTLIHALHAGNYRLREVKLGDTTLLGRLDGRGSAFAWQRSEFWVVFGVGLERGEAFSQAAALARAENPLHGIPSVRLAVEELGDPRGAVVVVNTAAFMERGLRTADDDPRLDDLMRREVHKRRFGEMTGANRLMADRLRLQTLDLALRPRTVREQLMRAAFFPFGPATLGLKIEERAWSVTYVQRLVPGSLPATSLRAGAPATVERVLGGAPAVHFGANLDLPVAMSLARGLALIANRGEVAAFEAALRSATGVALRRDLIEPSSGAFEVAISVDPSRFGSPVSLVEALHRVGAVARWSFDDRDKIKRSLERIERAFDWIAAAGDGRFVLELPGIPQIQVLVAAESVFAAFDSEPLDRIALQGGKMQADPPAGGGVADGGVADAQPTDGHRATSASALPRPEDETALFFYVAPHALAPMIDAFGGVTEVSQETVRNEDGPGTFAFEKKRGQTLADVLSAVEFEAEQGYDTMTVRVRLAAEEVGLSAAIQAILKASLPQIELEIPALEGETPPGAAETPPPTSDPSPPTDEPPQP